MTAGLETIDRLSRAVGGKVIMPVLQARVTPLLANAASWRARRGALLALHLAFSGARRFLAPSIRTVTQSVIAFLQDPHPRVRNAAVRALGRIALDFADPEDLAGETSDSIGELTAAVMGGRGGGGSGAAARARDAAAAARAIKPLCAAAGDLLLPALIAAAGPANAATPRTRGLAVGALVSFLSSD
jgi:hypothetical protein